MSPAAVAEWKRQLEGWAIPPDILAAAPESPWGFPTELFRSHAESDPADTPSRRRALEALPPGGSVLDVGAGAGAASLALVPPAARIVAVDESKEMLEAFAGLARVRGVGAEAVAGRWPDVAGMVGPEDVVTCHHVLYNVPDPKPFVAELTAHARRRVVLEITGRHPLTGTAHLWQRFHGLQRPSGPTADDAEAVLREVGVDPGREDHTPAAPSGGFSRRADVVAFVRRRLCLTPDRDPDVEAALEDRIVEHDGLWDLWAAGRRVVTFWWEGSA
jgi:SAM-dependent methyltransferase